ncbi:hypothetical protein LIER_08148 [Lithospermum erythrorhizon]|uniref:Uncharacterized protein n=1 Tax=Lithospermum erythrorhizon TaxID=34254 RepID=A0AAV3PB36_LITER
MSSKKVATDEAENHTSMTRGKTLMVNYSKNALENKTMEAVPQKKKLEKEPSQDINKSADAFIQRFRQQLLLQRLESLENYEQMLKRGT